MISIFIEYFYWHFTIAPFEILKIMQNYMIANWHRFLIVQHLKTLFSAWHRQNPSDFGNKSKVFTDKMLDAMADLYIRLIAAGIRTLIILTGLVWQVVIFIAFILLFLIWLAWPVISIYMIVKGFNLISSI